MKDRSLDPESFETGNKYWCARRNLLRIGTGMIIALVVPCQAQPSQPVVIPLELVNISTKADRLTNPSYKLGINIGFDGNVPKLYEFDTGAAGFFASYDTSYPDGSSPASAVSWWNGGAPTGQQITMQYTSGNVYANSTIAVTNLSFYPPSQTAAGNPLATISNVSVAQIGQALTAGSSGGTVTNTAWYGALQANQPPLQNAFYGDFGMGVYRNQGNPIATNISGLFAVLPQFQFAAGS